MGGVKVTRESDAVLQKQAAWILFVVYWSDGMRFCRSDWPGLCLFYCYQPLCVASQHS